MQAAPSPRYFSTQSNALQPNRTMDTAMEISVTTSSRMPAWEPEKAL